MLKKLKKIGFFLLRNIIAIFLGLSFGFLMDFLQFPFWLKVLASAGIASSFAGLLFFLEKGEEDEVRKYKILAKRFCIIGISVLALTFAIWEIIYK
jgi:hypothetical protein